LYAAKLGKHDPRVTPEGRNGFVAGFAKSKGGAEQMASKAGARIKITLRCSECKQRNYNTMKNKKNTPERLELNKYCPFCKKHTVHNETK